MIDVQNLVKHFGGLKAVNDLTFQVRPGEVLGFLGPNGAGKSTTMRMIAGYLSPDSGTVTVCGHNVQDEPRAVKAAIGYLPEGAPAYGDMTPADYLGFIAGMRQLPNAKDFISRAVEMTQLQSVLRQPIDTLSKGFKRRVGLAQALIHDPSVLILDEPTDGLDPNQKHDVRVLIRRMARDTNKTIVVSTHILEEVSAVCTRAVIIADGRMVADGSPDELQRRSRWHHAVTFHFAAGDGEKLEKVLSGWRAADGFEYDKIPGDRFCGTVFSRTGDPILKELESLLKAEKIPVDHLTPEAGRLDDVFRTLTTSSQEAA
jgi:ABC-2 type transport system ATP-binding protein